MAMNRSTREIFRDRYVMPESQRRRDKSLIGIPRNLKSSSDPLSITRRSVSKSSSFDPEVQMQLGRLSIGVSKASKGGIDNLLSSTDGEKHDYDWLLTPPETPRVSSSDRSELLTTSSASRSTPSAKSLSAAKFSKSERSTPARSGVSRESSTTFSKSSFSSFLPASNRSRATRSTVPATRSSTPSKARPPLPLTNTSSSTPARRSSLPPSSSTSRPSSPRKSLSLPDLPLVAPPNLRTTMPERSISAGRSRPGPPGTSNQAVSSRKSVETPTRRSARTTLFSPPVRSSGSNAKLMNQNASEIKNNTVSKSIKCLKDGVQEENGVVSAKVSKVMIFESSRYNSILFKEDLQNTNWLHSVDGDSDQGRNIFDCGFEPLPEPFGFS